LCASPSFSLLFPLLKKLSLLPRVLSFPHSATPLFLNFALNPHNFKNSHVSPTAPAASAVNRKIAEAWKHVRGSKTAAGAAQADAEGTGEEEEASAATTEALPECFKRTHNDDDDDDDSSIEGEPLKIIGFVNPDVPVSETSGAATKSRSSRNAV